MLLIERVGLYPWHLAERGDDLIGKWILACAKARALATYFLGPFFLLVLGFMQLWFVMHLALRAACSFLCQF
jgi:hypothetical protein